MHAATFRPWTEADLPFLWESLYRSLHVRHGDGPFPRSVLDEPHIAHYLEGFGSLAGDDAQICVSPEGLPIGAAWSRCLPSTDPGYGFVADEIPELGMAVDMRWRGRGIGRRLLTDLLDRHPAMSLSVDIENEAAANLYTSLGFTPVRTVGGSVTMLRRASERGQ